ncbi:CBS domain-containing protein [Neptuniibacter sp. PT8_73]|uniref:CBS domain-containing protein n=1 Tax=unclassified Neptuniibacter TaxID=2630693 RepID=UPI0039F675F8
MDLQKVSDCMSADFAKITPNMPVAEATRNLTKKTLLGGPVINETGSLVGWISEQDCLKVTVQVAYLDQRVATVNEIMSTDVLTIKTSDDLLSVAQQMLDAKPKTYPVVDESDKLVGVLTRRHVLDYLVSQIG